jgi:signal transduction histidine kinase/CheY-like chemotaxis protein
MLGGGASSVLAYLELKGETVAKLLKASWEENPFFEALFDAVPFVFLIVDSDGRIHRMNPAAIQFAGTDQAAPSPAAREENGAFDCILATGCRTGARASCQGCDLWRAAHEALAGANISRHGQPAIPCLPKPRPLFGYINAGPLQHDGRRYAWLMLADFTKEQKLLTAERLESLGVLAGGIAHDFNNALEAILANLQLALLKLEQGVQPHHCLSDAVGVTLKASELTKQLLTFAKGGAPLRKHSTALGRLIQEAVEALRRDSPVNCTVTIAPDLWGAEIDEGLIGQVLQNLLINALQALPGGGTIRVSASNAALSAGDGEAARFIRVAVQDNGIGIPRQDLSRIFDPFFTTKKDGVGLGLATAYSIIRKHHGYLEVDSAEGQGSTFVIHLPAAAAQPADQDPAAASSSDRPGARILLMDDEALIREVVGETLSFYGYQVALAENGQAAVAAYRQALEAGQPFQAVIMDLIVPGGMGGLEALAHLRSLDPGVKAVISSGYANDPVLSDFRKHGFCGALVKPYPIDDLDRILRQIIA